MIYAYWALVAFAVSFLIALAVAAAFDSSDPDRGDE